VARRNQEFQTIRSEGGLLPSDLLRRVIDPRGSLKGTRPEDYGLPQGERLNEVITQSWNRLRRHWGEFRAAAARLPEGEAGTGLTNDKWSLPLLRELGFGLLPTSASPEIAGRTYAISRFFGSVPIHLVGCGLSLDRRAAGVRGAAGGNPHGLVQEVLNRSPDHLWGIVGNGLRLRILRDNQALSRQSFLEFDLEAMFAAEAYSDFVLLWLVAHATRFAPRDGNRIESCWLEEWTKEAEEQGTRALKDLRGSVERALQVLGEGFTSHPKNTALREALRSGTLPLADFHGQLLRVVYRLIFLFVAEDRTLEGQSLLHPRDDFESARVARERYAAHYGTARLRDLAGKIKGSRHGDLWRQFQIPVGALSGEPAFEGTRRTLALPALGSFLWSPGSTADLNGAELTNHDFLEALRHLAFTRQGKVLRPVDYRNLGAEELGGVYESLLALTPQVSADGARFTFAEFAGNERKTSGSYYTPDSLVQCLLDSALDPVVEEAIKGKAGAEAEQAILGLKVCDPAVGSGHFLVGAAHRLARHLARVRAQAHGESEPSPLLYQHALRDVIGRCLYGVDLNPMAAELCRVSLWLEALEPGKPLSFLDHHIRVGNSLLGTTPALIAGGLPDEAFNPIEGDDKKACTELKKRNRAEGKGLGSLFVAEDAERAEALRSAAKAVDEMEDDTPERLARKAESFAEAQKRYDYVAAKRLADAWCAAFVIRKHFPLLAHNPRFTDTKPIGITQGHLGDLAQGRDLPAELARETERLARQYRFFHWHLAFPEVFARGGFNCVLGNPPWDKIQPEEEKFFGPIRSDIANAASAKERKALIEALPDNDPPTHRAWESYKRFIDSTCHFLRSSGSLRFTGDGNLNSYRIFTELTASLVASSGRAGLVAQTGLATDESGKELFDHLFSTGRLFRFLDFENRESFFPEVDSRMRFCLVTVQGRGDTTGSRSAEFGWLLQRLNELSQAGRLVNLRPDDLRLFNPSSRTCPVFTSTGDVEVSRRVYWHGEHVMLDEQRRFAQIDFLGELFNMTRDSGLFQREPVDSSLRLYEAKFIHQFDHRFASFLAQAVHELLPGEKGNPERLVNPKSWVDKEIVMSRAAKRGIHSRWMVGFRDIASPTNERTCIAAVFPFAAVGNSINLMLKLPAFEAGIITANANSFAFDFCARQKISGSHVNIWIFKQLPAIPLRTLGCCLPWLDDTHPVGSWIMRRALELTYTACDLEPFAEDCGWSGPPFRWDEERRFLIRCELDAAFFHLYLPADADGHWRPARKADGCPHDETPEELAELKRHFATPRDAVAYVMDTFPIVRRKDEEKYAGDYRTKRVLLEIYDAMQEAIRTGQPYRTRLAPPPGPPQDADGKFIPYTQIANNPPPHIHLPRGAVAGGSVTLQLSDLATRFPTEPFLLRLSTRGDAKPQRVRPVRTADIQAADRVVLASAKLRNAGTQVPAAIGKLRAEARTDASDGSAYVLVTVRGEEGTAQARFSEDEWFSLTTIGVVEDSAGS
jgi:hypothetical protein